MALVQVSFISFSRAINFAKRTMAESLAFRRTVGQSCRAGKDGSPFCAIPRNLVTQSLHTSSQTQSQTPARARGPLLLALGLRLVANFQQELRRCALRIALILKSCDVLLLLVKHCLAVNYTCATRTPTTYLRNKIPAASRVTYPQTNNRHS